MKILGIGWDVGGWMGKKNAFAFSSFDTEEKTFSFLSEPYHQTVPKSGFFDLKTIVEENDINFKDYDKIVIGIDAPLGSPRKYKEMINGIISEILKPEKEIFSSFAYRECERHIYQTFKKKPLSAPFDKIGNNLTLALYQAHFWNKEYGFNIHPQNQGTDDKRMMIEVYPALAKMEATYKHIKIFIEHFKDSVNDDEWDALICSLIATIHGAEKSFINHIKTVLPPNDKIIKEEGWIYYLE